MTHNGFFFFQFYWNLFKNHRAQKSSINLNSSNLILHHGTRLFYIVLVSISLISNFPQWLNEYLLNDFHVPMIAIEGYKFPAHHRNSQNNEGLNNAEKWPVSQASESYCLGWNTGSVSLVHVHITGSQTNLWVPSSQHSV